MATTLKLTWPANPVGEGVSKYQVLESSGGPFAVIAEVTDNLYEVLTPTVGMRWQVRAVNFIGIGPVSNIANGPDVPTKPGDITVTVVNA
jgi:hypothetical protein